MNRTARNFIFSLIPALLLLALGTAGAYVIPDKGIQFICFMTFGLFGPMGWMIYADYRDWLRS